MSDTIRQVPYLSGHFTPVPGEITARDLTVRGAIPPELSGRYFRNGHNPKPGDTPTHWFRGAGMLHGIRIDGGRAEWYRNRWVRTPALDGAPMLRDDGSVDLTASIAGTHVIEHAGRILALQEANLPFEMSPDLNTIGAYDFRGRLTTAMTAHPKEDPATGELHFFGYSAIPPYLTYYVADAKGELTHSQIVPGAGPTLMHDFGLTPRYTVWLDLPVVFDPAEPSGIPYRWSDTHRPRIGVLPRGGGVEPMWFEVEAGAMIHVTNAYEDARGRVVVEGPRYDRSSWESSWKWWTGAPGHPAVPAIGSMRHRWILDPASGTVREEPLDSLVTEFATINEALTGAAHRYTYTVAFPGAGLERYALVKYDATTGERQIADAGPGRMYGEPYFVPAAQGAAEDDGYLLTLVGDLARDSSELLVLDAKDITRPPIAAVELPRRVPAGIHGSWIPDAADAT
ncbi:carotenoid oxygenase family protein [Streptomyces kanamyceticus]|uniref:Dioxygenase n=1 Tax=Streptomyces kanamyceticus TaxID=1967 RepID=A0A5J6GNZ4_STRKN|nr:carotenoid oxygenase family protein [Streptomyces kanamyceticus]QEU96122.1 dioxygenase [Streptomyces kanamyceticus]